ncbi:hypothetical protein DM01DRAFT_1371854 [Hesseltinella vesiculosa]|uniref:Rho-GAP domain-containing protein n=1 Tax=Hesseltinella vesiculosa TaxID=101127 RepID=A0A1X2GQ07_9FUNG|nr:hypothetical protein DM01DRAFT_1371854 [Hesseltinella vesiculosa]
MLYSFDFGAQVSRICMDEIRRRGMDERKILRKSAPNSVLLLKVFRDHKCSPEDLAPVSIHSVATLMQDILWCCHERIVPKKVWKLINYETCTLPELSKVLTQKGEGLLVEILDFLVEMMKHKAKNLMDAYHLGEAMGKVTLGPADCDPIIAEKAGHFMTRMIIEHSKWLSQTKNPASPLFISNQHHRRLSGPLFDSSCTAIAALQNIKPMSKSEAAMAKAKSYDRIIHRIRTFATDWIDYAYGAVYALMEDEFESEPTPKEEPWISIFTTQLDPATELDSPLLYRILSQVTKPKVSATADPFASSYWFQSRQAATVAAGEAFSQFNSYLEPAQEPGMPAEVTSTWHDKLASKKPSFSKKKFYMRMKNNAAPSLLSPADSIIEAPSSLSRDLTGDQTIHDDQTLNDNDSAINRSSTFSLSVDDPNKQLSQSGATSKRQIKSLMKAIKIGHYIKKTPFKRKD